MEEVDGVSADDLLAYADDRLAPERRRFVADRLAQDLEAAAFVASCQRQNEALRAALDPALKEPVPRRLTRAARGRDRGGTRRRLAAAALVFAVGLGSGWGLGGRGPDAVELLGARAALAHAVHAVAPNPLLDLASDDPEAVTAWLAQAVPGAARVPRVDDLGFRLLGARLMMGQDAPAGLVLYERGPDKRLALFVSPESEGAADAAPRFSRDRRLGVVTWAEGGQGFGLAGPFGRDELMAVAAIVRVQWGAATQAASYAPTPT